jgi:hypothetical protein
MMEVAAGCTAVADTTDSLSEKHVRKGNGKAQKAQKARWE